MEESMKSSMEKPELFTTGSRIQVEYQSPHKTRNDNSKSAIGYVIADVDGMLVIEEYSTFSREKDHRHVLFDSETKNVFTQTQKNTQRIGQAVNVSLWAPPWETRFDTSAAGIAYMAYMKPEFQMIEEGIYEFLDPDHIDGFDSWDRDIECEDPIPDKVRERNAETVYKPPYDTDI